MLVGTYFSCQDVGRVGAIFEYAKETPIYARRRFRDSVQSDSISFHLEDIPTSGDDFMDGYILEHLLNVMNGVAGKSMSERKLDS